MDRRHRTVLVRLTGFLWGLGLTAAGLQAQPSPAPTPWVQAPPAANETPVPKPTPAGSPPAAKPTAPPPLPGETPAVTPPVAKPTPKSKAAAPPTPRATGNPAAPLSAETLEETKVKMERERKRELDLSREEQAPDEQQTFQQNLQLWDRMTRDERQAMREAVGGRIRVEVDEAYKRSGLNLNPDQHEMFDLRYRQERRKVEREVQEIARHERERRLPSVDEQMRREFGKASAANAAKAAPSPAATATAPPTPKPSPSATVSPTVRPVTLVSPSGNRRLARDREEARIVQSEVSPGRRRALTDWRRGDYLRGPA